MDDLSGAAIREAAEAGLDPVIELRRAIHREPELGIANPITIGRVGDALADLPLEVHRGEGEITSLWADMKGNRICLGKEQFLQIYHRNMISTFQEPEGVHGAVVKRRVKKMDCLFHS